jgi:hypothetical protein
VKGKKREKDGILPLIAAPAMRWVEGPGVNRDVSEREGRRNGEPEGLWGHVERE